MASQIEICNLALSYLGFSPITALDTTSKTGTACLASWNIMRDEVLSVAPWNFATKRVALAVIEDEPAFRYKYTYQLPADCIRVLEIGHAGTHYYRGRYSQVNYVVEGDKLLCNFPTLSLKYVYRVTETGRYSPGFVSALAARLAAAMCYGLIDNPAKRSQELLTIYAQLVKQAQVTDAREDYEHPVERDSWLKHRMRDPLGESYRWLPLE